jgi:hypothetical protein
VLNVIPILTENKEHGKWNWEYNHDLVHDKLYPFSWRKSLLEVYTDLAIGNPESDYILTSLYNDRDDMARAYGKIKEVFDIFVLRRKYDVCHGAGCHGRHQKGLNLSHHHAPPSSQTITPPETGP